MAWKLQGINTFITTRKIHVTDVGSRKKVVIIGMHFPWTGGNSYLGPIGITCIFIIESTRAKIINTAITISYDSTWTTAITNARN